MRFYVVLDDLETWSTGGYVVPESVLTDEQRALCDDGDSKVFKTQDIPGVTVGELVAILRDAGLWAQVEQQLLETR